MSNTITDAGHVIARVTRWDGSTTDLDLGDVDAVVDARWAELTVMAQRRDGGPITRATHYALGAQAYADVIDRGWPVW